MQNDIFDNVVAEFQSLFGAPQGLNSGNGTRFRKCSVTVYHENVASGNKAEIACKVESIAETFGRTSQAVSDLIHECAALTGRPVEINPTHGWPRIGIASLDQVYAIKARLSVFLLN